MRVYLAGPEVFLPDVAEIAARKLEICRRHGLSGVFPSDAELDLGGLSPRAAGRSIYHHNRSLMQDCDAMIVNMTPFRGPSMDVGSAFELGFMAALGKPVIGYSNTTEPYAERVLRHFGQTLSAAQTDDPLRDPIGLSVENHDMTDNLMLESAVLEAGFEVIRVPVAEASMLYRDLTAFEACADRFGRRREGPA